MSQILLIPRPFIVFSIHIIISNPQNAGSYPHTEQILKAITNSFTSVDRNFSITSIVWDLIGTVTDGKIIDEAGEILAEETDEGLTNEACLAIWFRNQANLLTAWNRAAVLQAGKV